MLKHRIFDYLIDHLSAAAEKRLLNQIRNSGLKRTSKFIDLDLKDARYNWTFKQRLLQLSQESPMSFRVFLLTLFPRAVAEKLRETLRSSENGAISKEMLLGFRNDLVEFAKENTSESEASACLAAAWAAGLFTPEGDELSDFGKDIINGLSIHLPEIGKLLDEESSEDANNETPSATKSLPQESSPEVESVPTETKAPEDDEILESPAQAEEPPAEKAPEESAGDKTANEEDEVDVRSIRINEMLPRNYCFEYVVSRLSGKAEKRIAAVLKSASPREAAALGGTVKKIKNSKDLKALLLRAMEAAPELFNRAMLSVASGDVNALLHAGLKSFKFYGWDEEKFLASHEWQDFTKTLRYVADPRVAECLSGLFSLKGFNEDGSFTLVGRDFLNVLSDWGQLPFKQHGAAWSDDADDQEDDAFPFASDGEPKGKVEVNDADRKKRAELPLPYGTLPVRGIILRWIFNNLSSSAEFRGLECLKSKIMRGAPFTRGVRLTHLRGNTALISNLIQADSTDRRILKRLLRFFVNVDEFKRFHDATILFAPVPRFLDDAEEAHHLTLEDLKLVIELADSECVEGAVSYLCYFWDCGLFFDETCGAALQDALTPVGQQILKRFDDRGILPLKSLIDSAELSQTASEALRRSDAAAPSESVQSKENKNSGELQAPQADEADPTTDLLEADDREATPESALGSKVEAPARDALDRAPQEADPSEDEPESVPELAAPASMESASREPRSESIESEEKSCAGRAELPGLAAPARPEPVRGCERWLGFVRRTGVFTNFFLFALWDSIEHKFERASEDALRIRFPRLGAVNLHGVSTNALKDGSIFAADIDLSNDLQPNLNTSGDKRPDFKYRLDFDRLLRQGRMHRAQDLGIYRVVYPEAAEVDFEKTIWVRLSPEEAVEPVKGTRSAKNSKVLKSLGISAVPVLLAYQGQFLGPWSLKEDAGHRPYISPPEDVKFGLAPGFSDDEQTAEILEVPESYRSGEATLIAMSAVVDAFDLAPGRFDVMTDRSLLTKAVAATLLEGDGNEKAASQTDGLLDKISDSLEIFSEVEPVAQDRRSRLEAMLQASQRSRTLAKDFALSAQNISNGEELSESGFIDSLVEHIAADPKAVRRFSGNETFARALEARTAQIEKIRSQTELERSKALAEIAAVRNELGAERAQLEGEVERLRKEKADIESALGSYAEADKFCDILAQLKAEVGALSEKKADLEKSASLLETAVANASQRAKEYIYDGEAAAKFIAAAATWNEEHEKENFKACALMLNRLEVTNLRGADLADYLTERVRASRDYSRNDILNIFLSLSQNFLTVFAGLPGSGKTSICSIISEAMGLELYRKRLSELDAESFRNLWPEAEYADRFLSISVERGWTSKRDFIGYWNPLSKTFESVDARRWFFFRLLDAEARLGLAKLPAVMLLDEANLSPMEYYWADFMNVCDGARQEACITLGDQRRTKIPSTLRFLATINSDHTTEKLSPRLIDRAAVITLPESDVLMVPDHELLEREPELVSADLLAGLFAPAERELKGWCAAAVSEIFAAASEMGCPISVRVKLAVSRAVLGAIRVFENDDALGQSTEAAAVDCAVASRLLPHLCGNGEDYADRLRKLRALAERRTLTRTAGLLGRMLSDGERAMGYYSLV